MAHTKSQGKTNQKSNRPGQRRGLKAFGGEKIKVGEIIIRQLGSGFNPGLGTKIGKDFTIYAAKPGIIKYYVRLGKRYVGVFHA